MDTARQLDQIRTAAADLAATGRSTPLDLPIPSCPGWELGRLIGHTGRAHRWASAILEAGGRPDTGKPERPPDGTEVVDWLEAGAEALVEQLAGTDPEAPSWHFAGGPQVAGFWSRRMTHETTIHAWDGRDAAGDPPALPADVASDGIDELLTVLLERIFAGADEPKEGLSGSLHVHCTDIDGEWLVRLDPDRADVTREHAKGDAALRGPAADLLLVLWNRRPASDAAVEVIGDTEVLDRWAERIHL